MDSVNCDPHIYVLFVYVYIYIYIMNIIHAYTCADWRAGGKEGGSQADKQTH